MTIFLALIVSATTGASPDESSLEKAFRERGSTGFLQAVRELEQEQGPERTAKILVKLASGHNSELAATAVHLIGRMGKAGKTVLPDLASAVNRFDFPAGLLNELGPGDIPLWFAEVLLRPDDPSFDNASCALAMRLDLRNEKRILPLLIQAVRQTDADAGLSPRYWAVRALGNMGEAAASSRQLLVEIMKDELEECADPDNKFVRYEVRGAAVCALAKIGTDRESTVRLLTEMLNHPDQRIRDWSTLGLALLEQKQNPARAAKNLVGLLSGDDDGDLKPEAIQAIGQMGEAGKAVLPELAKALNSSDFPVEYLDQYDFGDIPLWLAEALLRPDDPSFEDMGEALGDVVLDPKNARKEGLLPLLIQGARHPNLDVRWRAVGVLGWLGETAASGRPLLVDILKEEPPGDLTPSDVERWNDIRGSAAFSLGQIGAEPESTVRLLTEMLGNAVEDVWSWSARGLGRMEEKAAPAVPPLVEALARDYDTSSALGPFPKHPAAWALCNIGEPAIPALIEALQSKQLVVRRRAADALLWAANKKSALGALIKAATEDDDQEVRVVATNALRFRPPSVEDDALVLAAAIRILKDESPKVREQAVYVLWWMQSREEAPSQPLVDCLNDSDAKVRLTAVEAISGASPRKDIEPTLERLLNDPDRAVRSSARKVLKRLREDDEK